MKALDLHRDRHHRHAKKAHIFLPAHLPQGFSHARLISGALQPASAHGARAVQVIIEYIEGQRLPTAALHDVADEIRAFLVAAQGE